MTPTKPLDDLDALRAVIDAVKDFKPEEQQRIFRWAAEKLGLPQASVAAGHSSAHGVAHHVQSSAAPSHSAAPTSSGGGQNSLR
jgi:hypothetical protein